MDWSWVLVLYITYQFNTPVRNLNDDQDALVVASAQFRDHIDKLKSIPLVQDAKTGDMVEADDFHCTPPRTDTGAQGDVD
eukprot:scaffold1438_cov85-Cyclotella_meneghiniana.AAC.2